MLAELSDSRDRLQLQIIELIGFFVAADCPEETNEKEPVGGGHNRPALNEFVRPNCDRQSAIILPAEPAVVTMSNGLRTETRALSPASNVPAVMTTASIVSTLSFIFICPTAKLAKTI